MNFEEAKSKYIRLASEYYGFDVSDIFDEESSRSDISEFMKTVEYMDEFHDEMMERKEMMDDIRESKKYI